MSAFLRCHFCHRGMFSFTHLNEQTKRCEQLFMLNPRIYFRTFSFCNFCNLLNAQNRIVSEISYICVVLCQKPFWCCKCLCYLIDSASGIPEATEEFKMHYTIIYCVEFSNYQPNNAYEAYYFDILKSLADVKSSLYLSLEDYSYYKVFDIQLLWMCTNVQYFNIE